MLRSHSGAQYGNTPRRRSVINRTTIAAATVLLTGAGLLAGIPGANAAGGWAAPSALPTGAQGASQQRYPGLYSNADGTRVLATWSDFHYKPGSYSDADVVVMASWRTPSGWTPAEEIQVGGNRTDAGSAQVSNSGDEALLTLTQSKRKGRDNTSYASYATVWQAGKWKKPTYLPESNSHVVNASLAGNGKSGWVTWLVDNDAGTGGDKDTDGNAKIMAMRWNGNGFTAPISLTTTPEGFTVWSITTLSDDGTTGAACLTYESKDSFAPDDTQSVWTSLLRDGTWTAPTQYVSGARCSGIQTSGDGKTTWMLTEKTILNPQPVDADISEFNGNAVNVARLGANGTWEPAVTLNDNPAVTEAAGSTLTRIADDGTAFVAWNDNRINNHKQYPVRVSHLSAGVWSKPDTILTWTYDRGNPSISLSKNGKHATAASMRWFKGEPIASTWTPEGWSKPARLNKNAGYTPSVTASNTGRSGVAWMTLNCAWNNRPQKYCSDSMKAITAWHN